MRQKTYFLVSIPAAIIWAPIYMLPGILLGAISLEMPVDIAAGLLISILALLTAIWLISKITAYTYHKTHTYFSTKLDNKWAKWLKQPQKRWLCWLLKHAGRPEQRGQIILAANLIISFLLFAILFAYIHIHADNSTITLNSITYHLFRGLRTPWLDKIMLFISSLGYKLVLLPVFLVLAIFAFGYGRKNIAAHWLTAGIIAAGAVFICKHLAHSIRPPGFTIRTNKFIISQWACYTSYSVLWISCFYTRQADNPKNPQTPLLASHHTRGTERFISPISWSTLVNRYYWCRITGPLYFSIHCHFISKTQAFWFTIFHDYITCRTNYCSLRRFSMSTINTLKI